MGQQLYGTIQRVMGISSVLVLDEAARVCGADILQGTAGQIHPYSVANSDIQLACIQSVARESSKKCAHQKVSHTSYTRIFLILSTTYRHPLPAAPRSTATFLIEGYLMSPQTIEEETKTERDPRAFNAYRHGLTGQVMIMTPSDEAAYTAHCQGFHQALAPEGAVEKSLAQSIADDQWRPSPTTNGASSARPPSISPASPRVWPNPTITSPTIPKSTPPSLRPSPGPPKPRTSTSCPSTRAAPSDAWNAT
ncbi:hypothetical protein SBA3_1390022 [Candidatus Sulfopaludibacter sp. SbA3]|nr:hypothetical protein SBA3_1390022 [Candidatus Sulfopaludibacter sp. SbA3]